MQFYHLQPFHEQNELQTKKANEILICKVHSNNEGTRKSANEKNRIKDENHIH